MGKPVSQDQQDELDQDAPGTQPASQQEEAQTGATATLSTAAPSNAV